MLATLNDLKAKLGIDSSDTALDGPLELVLESASDRVLKLCRYSEAEADDQVEYFQNVRNGDKIWLPMRPVKVTSDVADVSAQGRAIGIADWADLAIDVLDPDRGIVAILDAADWRYFTPDPIRGPRRTRYKWAVVKVTYSVTGVGSEVDAPKAVQDATAALAAYWYDRHVSGAAESISIGSLRKSILTEAIPEWIESALADRMEEGQRARWV